MSCPGSQLRSAGGSPALSSAHAHEGLSQTALPALDPSGGQAASEAREAAGPHRQDREGVQAKRAVRLPEGEHGGHRARWRSEPLESRSARCPRKVP